MRPFTLKTLGEVLNLVRLGGEATDRRLREVLKVARDIGLVVGSGNRFELTDRGRTFLEALEREDAFTIHNLLYESLEPYRRIYDLYRQNVSVADLMRASGYNAVVVDVVLRLIRELESLGGVREEFFDKFVAAILERYKELRRRRWSRYVPIVDLLNEVKVELGVPMRVVYRMFEDFVAKWRDKIILTGSPSGKSIELFGKKYVYVMIDV